MPKPQARAKTPAKPVAKPPKHTVPIEEHPGYTEGGEPQRTSNGPRDIDPKQNISQDPNVDYAAFSSTEHGVLGADEEV